MMDFRFRPLLVWPYPVTRDRFSVPFKAPYPKTIELLAREIEALDGSGAIIAAGWREVDIRQDGIPRSNAPLPAHPGVELSFDSRFGRLVYATDRYEARWSSDMPGWQANLRAIALSLVALRAVDRYGVSNRGQQYAGWKALPGIVLGAGDPQTADEAFEVLREAAGLSPADADLHDVRQLYRLAVKRTHPDIEGGDAERFRRVEVAYRLLGAVA